MPKLINHQSTGTTKLLLIGDSGAGKTGALSSLPAEGYRLRIIDTDNGLDLVKNLLTDPAGDYYKKNPKAIENVDFVTLTDTWGKNAAGKLVPKTATVWERTIGMLENWKDGEIDYGSITTWTPQDVLVIDSLTTLSNAALNRILAMNGRLGGQVQQSDWYSGQNLVEGLLQLLYDEAVRCNVIVCCHITFIETDAGPTKGYPMSLGKALPPKIGRYFNSSLMVRSMGQGTNVQRKIITNTAGVVELKNTAPTRVRPEYDIKWGLAEYFAAVRGQQTQQTASSTGGTK